MPKAERVKTFDRAERRFGLMQKLRCDLLMLCSTISPGSLGGIGRAAELGERAARRGFQVRSLIDELAGMPND